MDTPRIPTPEERATNARELGQLTRQDRFRLMFGHPPAPKTPAPMNTPTPRTDAADQGCMDAQDALEKTKAVSRELEAELAEIKKVLANPTAVMVNLMAGKIAKPSLKQIGDIYGIDLSMYHSP